MSTADMAILDDDVDEDDTAWSRREAARMKQIQIGKARPEYQRYLREVPKSQRRQTEPSTPDPSARVSKRQFDRALADWRRLLHDYDIVPRNAPQGRHHEKPETHTDWYAWDATGDGDNDDCRSRHSYHRARQSRGCVAPRGDRSLGKFGPRKSANDMIEDEHESTQVPAEPEEEAPTEHEVPPGGAVRISLADQLWEMPFQASAVAPMYAAYPWYDESCWSNVETPQKMFDMQQYMLMDTPDKLMMPFQGPDMMQQACFDSFASVDGFNADGFIVPHKLFEVAPETLEECQLEECQAVDIQTAQSDTQIPENPDEMMKSITQISENHDEMMKSIEERGGAVSPRPVSKQHEMSSSPSVTLQSPSVRCQASPSPTTPKRHHYVPDTPSPSRLHYSWQGSTIMADAAAPWHVGTMAFGSYQAMPPEFMQGMSSS